MVVHAHIIQRLNTIDTRYDYDGVHRLKEWKQLVKDTMGDLLHSRSNDIIPILEDTKNGLASFNCLIFPSINGISGVDIYNKYVTLADLIENVDWTYVEPNTRSASTNNEMTKINVTKLEEPANYMMTYSGYKKLRKYIRLTCGHPNNAGCPCHYVDVDELFFAKKASFDLNKKSYESRFKQIHSSDNCDSEEESEEDSEEESEEESEKELEEKSSNNIPIATPIIQETLEKKIIRQPSAKGLLAIRNGSRTKFIVSADIQSKLEDLIDSLDEFTISYYDNEVVDDDASVIVIENISKENVLVAMRMYK